MSTKATNAGSSPAMRWALVLIIAALAFFASYRYAVAQSGSTTGTADVSASVASGTSDASAFTASGSQGSSTSSAPTNGAVASAPATSSEAPVFSGATGAGGCCGSGGSGGSTPPVTKKAQVKSGVQIITVDTSKGYYDPNTVELKAGIPAEITFSQSSGCLTQVQSQDLGFYENLGSGPKTIKLPALKAGTYAFSCGMQMVAGTIVVK